MSFLYIVPTPIGNLEDITFRAIRYLKEAGLILAEDTRTTAKLLRHYGIDTKLQSYHQHNEHRIASGILDKIQSGVAIALVSDAGTPGISDPGFLLVRECLKAGIAVECLPGPTAFVPALVCSGLPCEKFVFEGFLPQKKGRKSRMERLANEERTMVFYESPHRIKKTLSEFATVFGLNREISLSREISKIHEEHLRGTIEEVIARMEGREPKGEMCLVVAGVTYRQA